MNNEYKRGHLPSSSSAEEMSAPKVDTTALGGFKTPEQATASIKNGGIVVGRHDLHQDKKPSSPSSRLDKLKAYYAANKKACLISAALILVIFGVAGYLLLKPEQKIPPVKIAKITPKITTVASTLTGLQVDPSVNQRVVTAIMIENSTEARPQAGLSQSGVVFEAIAEGGITRFLALFQDTDPNNIGPVRSARPYYIQWALGFDAGYAHVGGSPEALADIKAWSARDLDQFFNSGAYHRISDRPSPHNVYTSIAALNQLEASKGFVGSTYTGFLRKTEKATKVPTAKLIDFSISGPVYSVHYDYVAKTNSYNRSEGGAPHIDSNTNQQISPKVVIALVVPYSLEADGTHSDYGVIGSGQAFIFQDGGVTVGNWSKADNKSQVSFTDSAGLPVKLNPGQTWLTAVKAASNVTYTP